MGDNILLRVTITGINFGLTNSGIARATIGGYGYPCAPVTSWTTTRIVCGIPSGYSGAPAKPVVVTASTGLTSNSVVSTSCMMHL